VDNNRWTDIKVERLKDREIERLFGDTVYSLQLDP